MRVYRPPQVVAAGKGGGLSYPPTERDAKGSKDLNFHPSRKGDAHSLGIK